ncbi:RETICULON-LIKE PROTEIN B12 [Salix koriyanagi]|uniref:Reticulon-like protein n=1 Tax=Salix koriyanagi TaxID=2511006 RepID=A0A9Q1ANX1_9ROSI|nr:RETICULON-LIKE PROTEIN B12 [Salix koriyanagi]
MGSSSRLFNRQRTVHEIFGGGFVADVILWRQMNITIGVLLAALSSWVVFERSGYTLLSLVSSVLLLLAVILFLWAKSAAILNRPPPPFTTDIALGKDTKLFLKVAAYLSLISVVGVLTDFLTLGYASLLIVLTIPALYERYEDYLDRYAEMVFKKSQQLYLKFDAECTGRVQKWILERQKLS